MDALERQVVALIAQKKKVAVDSITLDTTFAELGIDSLDAIDLLFTFEDTFKISVPDEVAREMKTIRAVTEGLRAALAAGGASGPAA
jgi:acyl carrier protein